MNLTFLNLSLAGYFLACICYFIYLNFKNNFWAKIATLVLAAGFVFNTVAVLGRWYTAGRAPLVNLHESLVFFSWSIVLIYLIFEFIYKFKILGSGVSLLALLFLGYASILDKTIQPLLPALKSNWLVIHVITYFIGYGAVSVAFASGLLYLMVAKKAAGDSALVKRLDILNYRLIAFAFPFLTIGLTTGAVWANVAWGSYWSWDPKETWSLITWLIYALYLHARIVRGWKGRRAIYLSVIGFLAVLFTFLGVNLFLAGLHSYN